MRVIAGTARSLKLKTPQGASTRPTTDRIKETLFNMIQGEIPGCVFLDLFAGSGGIGIEALSRGARHAYFVENQKEPIDCITENLQFTRLADRATVLKEEAAGALSLIHEKQVDIVFMDPPYEAGYEPGILALLSQMSYVTEDTLIIIEAVLTKEFDFAQALGYDIIREKNYKTNKHVFFKKRRGDEIEKGNLSGEL